MGSQDIMRSAFVLSLVYLSCVWGDEIPNSPHSTPVASCEVTAKAVTEGCRAFGSDSRECATMWTAHDDRCAGEVAVFLDENNWSAERGVPVSMTESMTTAASSIRHMTGKSEKRLNKEMRRSTSHISAYNKDNKKAEKAHVASSIAKKLAKEKAKIAKTTNKVNKQVSKADSKVHEADMTMQRLGEAIKNQENTMTAQRTKKLFACQAMAHAVKVCCNAFNDFSDECKKVREGHAARCSSANLPKDHQTDDQTVMEIH